MAPPPGAWDETAEPFDSAGSPSAHGKKIGKASTRRRRALLYTLAALILVLTASGTYVYNLGRIYDSKTTKIEDVFPDESLRPPPRAVPGTAPQGTRPNDPDSPSSTNPAGPGISNLASPIRTGAPVNILLLGSDSRNEVLETASSGSASNQRADTIMLLHIPADRSTVYSISLMRDLWVRIPGNGSAKINAALAFGGVPLMVRTIEDLLQQRIDHVAMIDFAGFKELTDGLGGVEVTIDKPFTSYHDHFEFSAGKNKLNGERALAFVRERYAYSDGDYQRVRNQQAFLRAVVGKALSAGTLGNPMLVHNLLDVTAPYISVDAGLDAATVGSLALSLRDIRKDDVVFFTLPTSGTGRSGDGQSIVVPDLSAIRAMAAALGNDSLGDYVAEKGLGDGN
ncbi:LCP family protein [Arthrobacter rhizosphaerae]|uniref:LCP family protein n=1 Tax=Arthrobacter rhizosphaerae TaxID=2855490 RepID=UPI001FF5FB5B|nr:LCP family protein [Arthrobacter rhizosphaerae]